MNTRRLATVKTDRASALVNLAVMSIIMNYLPKSNGKDNCLKSRFCLSCNMMKCRLDLLAQHSRSLITVENLVVVSHTVHACRRFQKFGGRGMVTP